MPSCLWIVALATPWASGAECSEVLFRPLTFDDAKAENRVKDPGFEHAGTSRSDWRPFGKGFEVDREVRFEGQQSIRCTARDTETALGATRVFELNHDRVVPVRVRARSRCEGVEGTPLGGYSIWVDIIHNDGSPTWGLMEFFTPGTHGWEEQTLTVMPVKPIARMFVHLLFRGVKGTAWFDDACVQILDTTTSRIFDGEAVDVVKASAAATRTAQPLPIVASADGSIAVLGDRESGLLTGVRLRGERRLAGSLPGGILVQDAGERGPIHRVTAPMHVEGAIAKQHTSLGVLGLDVTTTLRAEAKRIRGRIHVRNRDDSARSLSVAAAIPLPALGWHWHADIRRSEEIRPNRTYWNTVQMNAGKTGTASRYPLAAIADGDVGVAIAVPLDEPRIVRLAYDAQQEWLIAAFDFAASSAVKKLPNQGWVDFEVFSFDGRWGFRAALQRYYELHPDAFRRRVSDVGLWMAFAKISEVERPEDFGFYFKEGLGDQAYDNAHGIRTFRYTEPQSQWMPMPKGMKRSYDQAVRLMEQRARDPRRADRTRYQAVLTSGAKNADGRYHVTMHEAPWCDGAVFALNPDPELPGEVNKARVNYDPNQATKLYADEPQHGIDGEYLDSLDGWSSQRNYRPAHLACADVPPVYDPETRRPCLLNAFSIWEFVRWMSRLVHGQGKLMMANATPTRYPWQVAWLDVMGQETNWKPNGQWRPMTDVELCYRRSLCATKPYLLLQNSDFTRWTKDDTRRYFMRAGAYGVLPSFFSANAATDHYFRNPTWYNRDRPLFKRFVPVIRRIALAGWRPVTHARAEPQTLQVERFGEAGTPECFLTVHNPTEEAVSGRLTVLPDLRAARANDLIGGLSLRFVAGNGDGASKSALVNVPAQETLFLQLHPKN